MMMGAIEMYTLWCEYTMDCYCEGEEPLSYEAWLDMWDSMA